ncbi:MAG: molybdopterin-dependent oxidoreductase [bacterium]|nr:molybdopterin-dependent oxidoreductase [bacterium]
MTDDKRLETILEPERYELSAGPLYCFELDRREFFQLMGCGLAVFCLTPRAEGAETIDERSFAAGQRQPAQIAAWLHIGEDGVISVYTGKAEIGQNIRTSLAQALADELPAPFDSIRMVMADTRLTPYDAGTFGSQTTPRMSPILRKAGAAAREALIQLAAERWGTGAKDLKAEDGKITGPGSKSISYGELTKGKQLMESIAGDPEMKQSSDWAVSGRSIPKVGACEFVTGEHRYASDHALPGMLIGKVLRPAFLGASLKSADLSAAQAMEGVTAVQDGDFIGVAAPDLPTAEAALLAIKAEWTRPDSISSKELYSHLVSTAGRSDGAKESGSLETGFSAAAHTLEAEYTIAYIAHTPLEPRAALAVWQDGGLMVWTGSQRPFGVQEELQRAFRLPPEKVHVIVPDTGSGYGGKHTGEAAVEAARLAKAAGAPVKVIWTRTEEFSWAYVRPAGVIRIKGGVAEDGSVAAWEAHNYNSGSSGLRPMYEFPNQSNVFHRCDSPLRQGSYRGLAATANHFARESFIDELAHAAGMDPLAFRLKNMRDERFIGVLTAAAERFGWKESKSTPERGFGLAAGFEKNSYVATCAEIEIDKNKKRVRVVRVVEAFDCGPVINPDHLNNQIEGMILMGIGGALFESIEFANGNLTNGRLSQYPVPRFKDAPAIETVLMNTQGIYPAGAGETPIVGIAPAIANAIFSSTGKRIRSMPIQPELFA